MDSPKPALTQGGVVELVEALIDQAFGMLSDGTRMSNATVCARLRKAATALERLAAIPASMTDMMMTPEAIDEFTSRPEVIADIERLAGERGGEAVAWACTDLVLDTVSIIQDAAHAAHRANRPLDWSVVPLYAAPQPLPVEGLPPISLDGPHKPSDVRQWLARQLLDSRLDDGEALGVVAYHPAIAAALAVPPETTGFVQPADTPASPRSSGEWNEVWERTDEAES